MKYLSSLLLLCLAIGAHAQYNRDSVLRWREHYKQEFLTDEHSPLKAADTGFLRFYEPDGRYVVKASFTPTPDSRKFDIETHSGKKKPYRCYGILRFKIDGKECSLAVYQGLDLIKRPELKDYLFLPFTDFTNNETTFGGGRYLDFRAGQIRNGSLIIDFNRAYNPYCAFAEGYSCPIPPDENKLQVRIEAGEKKFGREPAE